MRKLQVFSILFFSVLFLFPSNSFSQEMKDQLYAVHEEKAKEMTGSIIISFQFQIMLN